MIAAAERLSSAPSATGENGTQSVATAPSIVGAGNMPNPAYPVRRIMVTGSRDWTNKSVIDRALFEYWYKAGRVNDIVLVEGGARGADALAKECWTKQGYHTETHYADWDTLGKRAGVLRNLRMLDTQPEAVLAFIKNNSRGASHAAAEAERRGIPVHYYRENTP